MGDVFSNLPAYEALLNEIITIDSNRKSEIPQGANYLTYGVQQLDNGRIYKAMDYLGKALNTLHKEESKDELVFALYAIGNAYERAGLNWAARGALINAACFAVKDFWAYNDVNTMQARCYHKLKWLELKLGRVSLALEWHQLDFMVSRQLAVTEEEIEELFIENYYEYGFGLACLLIKTPLKALKQVAFLPDLLNRFDLDFAGYTLLYLLSGNKELPPAFLAEE